MKKIDKILNNYTMYKVMLYGLIILAFSSIFFSLTGLLSFTPVDLISSLLLISATGFVTKVVFSKVLRVVVNIESTITTSLILFLIISPPSSLEDTLFIMMASIVAVSSKFLVKFKKRHVFNPAAFGAFVLGVAGIPVASWWVANPIMIPITIFVSFIVLRKIRKFLMFSVFFIASYLSVFYFNIGYAESAVSLFLEILNSWPILFLGSVMLTEPRTMPTTHKWQLAYGGIVGLLFGSSFSIGPLYSSPEFALLTGNVLAYLVSQKRNHELKLIKIEKFTDELYNFIFTTKHKVNFKPGQYMEWTLGHSDVDLRGNRRYLSLANSPTEENIMLGVKIPKNDSSSFKSALKTMKDGSLIYASHVSGDFTLPNDKKAKITFIAGGIGITPIRSMIKYLLDKKELRDVTLLYTAKTSADFIYKDIFEKAVEEIGLNLELIATARDGYITKEQIKKLYDYKNRKYYLSGPNKMVNAYKRLLSEVGVSKRNITLDYFPGY